MTTWKEKLPWLLGLLLMLGLIVVYVFEFYFFQRTFSLSKLLLPGALAGVLTGVALGWRFSRTAEDAVDRIQIYLFWTFLATVFFPLLTSLGNRLLSPHPAAWESVAFFEQKPYVSDRFGIMKGQEVKPSGYYLFFFRNGELERIDNVHPLAPAPERGDTILIPVRKGLFGVEWVVSDRQPWRSSGLEE
jgi:hypothetical protein